MKTKQLENLKKECEKCTACELYSTRNNIVFADGNPDKASIVLIGEAPGENEDLRGIPFVGRAGKLLNEFLQKAGINREKDLYIINTIKCRPPKNRIPTDKEKKACRDFLLSQIEIINPKIILLCGATAMKSFSDCITSFVTLNSFDCFCRNFNFKQNVQCVQGRISEQSCDAETSSARRINKPKKNIPISKIRGQFFEIDVKGKKYKAMPIFHPSYLLRNHSIEPNTPRYFMLEDLKNIKKIIS